MCFPCFLLRCCFAGRSVRRLFDLRCCWRTGCCHMVALEVKKCSSRSMWFFFFFLFFNSYSHLLNIILSFYRNSPQKHFRIYSGKRMWWMSTYQAELRWLTTVTSNNKKKGSFLFPGSAPVRITYIEWATKCVSARFFILQRMTTWQVSHEVLENKQLLFHFFSDLQMARTVNILKNT